MHGTYLNNVQLPANTSLQIKDNDELKFGAEVRRGPEIFPACRFRIRYEVLPYKYVLQSEFPHFHSVISDCPRPMNTFEFPEYSDSDSEEDCQYSDDDPRQQASSEDGVSIESPSSKTSKDVEAIDLTRDDSLLSSPVIDLTEEAPAEQRIMDLMVGRPTDINDNTDHVSIGVFAGNPMTVIDDSDQETHFSSESEDHQGEDNCIDSESSEEEGYSVDELDENEISDSDEEDYDMEEGYPEDDVQEEAMMETPDVVDNITSFAIATHENPSILLSDSQEPMKVADSVEVEDDSDNGSDSESDSDFGLSKAGAEGLRVMYRDGLLQKHADTIPEFPPQVSKIENSANAESVPVFQSTTELSTSIAPAQQHMVEKPLGLPSLTFRQPSPSDAAMVKIRVDTADTGIYCNPAIQSLGEKSGKSTYFAAREINKLRYSHGEPKKTASTANTLEVHDMLSSAGSDAKSSLSERPFAEPRKVICPEFGPSSLNLQPNFGKNCNLALVSQVESTLYLKKSPDQPPFGSTIPTREAWPSLDKPDTKPLPPRAPSPLPDMTSAMNYTTSKDSMAAAASAAKTASNPPRTALKIDEMCISTFSTPTLKRKAVHISSSTDQELRSWGNDTSTTAQFSSNIAASEPKFDQVTLASSVEAPRPTKRFKNFMEKVGYAAIGGVAVGASLFTVLVATAPNFS